MLAEEQRKTDKDRESGSAVRRRETGEKSIEDSYRGRTVIPCASADSRADGDR